MREELWWRGAGAVAVSAAASSEHARYLEMWAYVKFSGELASRMDREVDSLHAKIFCLVRTNKESAMLLSAMANQHLCSPGKAAAGPAPQAAEEEWRWSKGVGDAVLVWRGMRRKRTRSGI
jgi:hypothetical protein